MQISKLLFMLLIVQSSGLIVIADDTSTLPEKDSRLVKAVIQEFALDTAVTEIDVLRNSIPADVLTSQAHLRFESYNREPRGLVSMTVYVTLRSGEIRPYTIQLRIKTFASGFVALAAVKQKSAVDLSLFEKRRIETTFLPDQLWEIPEAIHDYRVTRSLLPGSPLTRKCVELVPLIEVGGLVTISIETPTVKIATAGTALEAGRKGARIRVRNQTSGKALTAVIRDSREVVITE